MSLLRTLPSLAAACGLALSAAAASAQSAPPPAAPAGQTAPGMQRGGMMHEHMMHEHMAHMRAEHLSLLHDALAIRPDQEGAWQAFAAAMAPPPAGEPGWGAEGEMGARLTTPERLDRMQARMARHMEAFQRHAAAVKALYAVLSPAQQRTFDALVRLMHGMHGMHAMRGGYGHEGMGMGGGMGMGHGMAMCPGMGSDAD